MNLIEAVEKATMESYRDSCVMCVVSKGETDKQGGNYYEVMEYEDMEEVCDSITGYIECIEGRDFSGTCDKVPEMASMFTILQLASGTWRGKI
jgi:hypothetical protein